MNYTNPTPLTKAFLGLVGELPAFEFGGEQVQALVHETEVDAANWGEPTLRITWGGGIDSDPDMPVAHVEIILLDDGDLHGNYMLNLSVFSDDPGHDVVKMCMFQAACLEQFTKLVRPKLYCA